MKMSIHSEISNDKTPYTFTRTFTSQLPEYGYTNGLRSARVICVTINFAIFNANPAIIFCIIHVKLAILSNYINNQRIFRYLQIC